MLIATDLRNLGADELTEKLGQLKKSLMQYRFQAKTGKLETKNVLKTTKKDIARIMTVLNEVKAAAPKAPKASKPPKAPKAASKVAPKAPAAPTKASKAPKAPKKS